MAQAMAWGGLGVPRWICKSSAETVNNSTTFQNDDHFTFAIAANEVWLLHFHILVTAANTTADIKFQFSVPAAATYSIGAYNRPSLISAWGGEDVAQTPLAVATSTLAIGTNAATIPVAVTAIIVNGANAGTVTLQWAQNTLSATNLTIEANSIMEYTRVK